MEFNQIPPHFNMSFSIDDSVKVFVDINSRDEVVDIGYKTDSGELEKLMEQICHKLKGQKATDSFYADHSDIFSLTDLVCSEIKDRLEGKAGTCFSSDGRGVASQIICRCKGLDRQSLEKVIESTSADFSQTVESTGATLTCGGCTGEFEKLMQECEWMKNFFQGQSNIKWIRQIEKAVSESTVLNAFDMSLISYQANLVKFRLNGDRQGKKRDELTALIESSLRETIHPALKVSIVF